MSLLHQKWINLELCVCSVPEWNLPNKHKSKINSLIASFITQPWWWVIYFLQSQDVLDWFWTVHHWNTEGLNMRLLQTRYLGQGGILSFGSVDSVLAFPSTLLLFCSFFWGWLCERAEHQNCDEADQKGLLKDSNTLRWFCLGLPKWNLNSWIFT